MTDQTTAHDLITTHEDGSIEVSPLFAQHIMTLAAQAAHPYMGPVNGDVLTVALAVSAGYTAGVTVADRNAAADCLHSITQAFHAGMGAGMEDNGQLPRLNA